MKKTNVIKLPIKEKEMKWWDVDCVLIQRFTIGIDGADEEDAIESTKLEYEVGNIQPRKEPITEEKFKIEEVRLMEDQDQD